MLLATLADSRAEAADRILAAKLAGNVVVINDALIEALLSVLQNKDESEELRGAAAVAMGPVLEYEDTGGFDDMDDVVVSEAAIDKIQETLHRLHLDAAVPKTLRRRVLEVSIRSPQDWHRDAIRSAWSGKDEDWRLTAVFAMRWVHGFDKEILKALKSDNPDIRYEAVYAAGNWEMEAAWPHVSKILKSKVIDKELLLAAIDAAVAIRPEDAGILLVDLTNSDDEDIADAAYEAMAMIDGMSENDVVDYDDEDDEDY
jgi:HEAT repeat protein